MPVLYFEIMGLFCVSVLLCLLILLLGLLSQRRRFKEYIDALEQATTLAGSGVVLFNEKERFVNANTVAQRFLSDLFDGQEIEVTRSDLKLSDFLNYFFDHAVETDQNLMNTLGRSFGERDVDARVGFREIITASKNRLCLVETEKAENGWTTLSIIDVGDIKSQEDQLTRMNELSHQLHQAIQVARSGIMITRPAPDGKHVIVFANNAFFEALALPRQKVIGQTIEKVFSKIKDEKTVQKIVSIENSGMAGHVEMIVKSRAGGERWHELHLSPVSDHAGHLEMFIGIMSDITELKMREAESSKTQKLEALGQLSAGVAHDFNNVLSIIDGYARLTENVVKGEEKAQENLKRIRTAAGRGANMIKQMLTFSRHKIVEETVIDLGEVLKEAETLLKPLLDATVKCKILHDQQHMHVECAPDTITQILMNVVVNSRDAMPHGGTLLVEGRICPPGSVPKHSQARDDVDYAFLKISDTGSGMPKDVMDRIFDPFFTTKEQGKGTGLGLSMVYGLVKQIGGFIDVSSMLGQGTIFTIYLPLTDRAPKEISGSEEDIASIRFDGYTVLVAEDEPDLRELVCDMLSERGMNVLQASDGHEALAVQDEHEGKIDLLLSDVVMPEMNGVELADLLVHLCEGVRVIFMSGYPAKGQMAPVEIPDNADFIAKPINHDDLMRVIWRKLQGESLDVGDDTPHTSRWRNGEQGEGK